MMVDVRLVAGRRKDPIGKRDSVFAHRPAELVEARRKPSDVSSPHNNFRHRVHGLRRWNIGPERRLPIRGVGNGTTKG